MDASESKVFRTEGSLLLKRFSAINSIYHNCVNITFKIRNFQLLLRNVMNEKNMEANFLTKCFSIFNNV